MILATNMSLSATGSLQLIADVSADEADSVTSNNRATRNTAVVQDLVHVEGFESCDGGS